MNEEGGAIFSALYFPTGTVELGAERRWGLCVVGREGKG